MISEALERIFEDLQFEALVIDCGDTESRRRVLLALQENGVDINTGCSRTGYISEGYQYCASEFTYPAVYRGRSAVSLTVYSKPQKNMMSESEFLLRLAANQEMESELEMPDIQSLLCCVGGAFA